MEILIKSKNVNRKSKIYYILKVEVYETYENYYKMLYYSKKAKNYNQSLYNLNIIYNDYLINNIKKIIMRLFYPDTINII